MTNAAPADDDLKQMFVYNHLLGTSQSILVYPSVDSGWQHLDGRYVACEHRCGSLGIRLFDGPAPDTGSMISQVQQVLDGLSGSAFGERGCVTAGTG